MSVDLQPSIRAWVAENFLFGDASKLSPSQSLLRSGVMDSTGVMELIAWLEETWDVQVEDAEVVPGNLDSVASIARFLERKLAGARVAVR